LAEWQRIEWLVQILMSHLEESPSKFYCYAPDMLIDELQLLQVNFDTDFCQAMTQ
jgi:hypothetical protein